MTQIHDQNLEHLLQSRFGLTQFRRGQREIIESILNYKDVLAVLPTGGGKSLCFQFPAVMKNQLVIVISPLIALMKDQVVNLQRHGIPAGCLHSGQSEQEKRQIFSELKKGGAFILYLSPERAQKPGFHHWIQQQKIAAFAIDEAHCVSQWGHDFRQEYSMLSILKKLRPDVPILALTASATPVVLLDIAKNLDLKKPDRHVHGFYRPNLYFQVESCSDDEAKLLWLRQSLLQHSQGRIIVYCGTRKVTESIAAFLALSFAGVDFYHAGLTNQQRHRVQEDYEKNRSRILVATNAFGMGIDHSDVRLVVHFQMPSNIDALYQEMGRAGRDGNPSTCLLLFSAKDKGLQNFFIRQSEAPKEIIHSRYRALESLINYAQGSECRHAEILTYYRDSHRIDRCGHCDICSPDSHRRVVLSQGVSLYEEMVSPSNVSTNLARRSRSKKSEKLMISLDVEEQNRFEALRTWRRLKSKELDQPAFMVFSDRTLKELAIENPEDLSALAEIHGFGPQKIEKFGSEVLSVLKT